MLALGHQIDPPGPGTTQGGYQADRLWGKGLSQQCVPAFRTGGGISGDLTLDFITSTSSPNWIRWQSMKSRASRLAFCLEMRRNVVIDPESASHPSPRATRSMGSCSLPWLAILPFPLSCIHPPIHPTSIHSAAFLLQPVWCSAVPNRRQTWCFFLSKTHKQPENPKASDSDAIQRACSVGSL